MLRENKLENFLQPLKIVEVWQFTDFPAPVAGVITLAEGIEYRLNGTINIGINRIELPTGGAPSTSVLVGENRLTSKLIYTGSGVMITGVGCDLLMRYLQVTCATAGSSVFSLSGASEHSWIFDNYFNGCRSLGTVEGGNFIVFSDNHLMYCYDGLTVNSIEHFFYENNTAHGEPVGSTGKYLNIPAGQSFEVISIVGNYLEGITGWTLIYIDSTTTLDLNAGGEINGNIFDAGGATVLGGITTKNVNWRIYGNIGLQDGKERGTMYWSNNALATTIASSGVYYPVNGADTSVVTIAGSQIERFEMGVTTNFRASSVVITSAILVTVTTLTPHNLQNGVVLFISGVTGTGAAFVNGTQTITVTGTNSYTFPTSGASGTVVVTSATAGANNLLTYIGKVELSGSVIVAGDVGTSATKSITLSFSKNGTASTESTVDIRTAGASNPTPFTFLCDIGLVVGDVVRIVVRNNTDTVSVLVSDCNVLIR